MTIQEFIDSIAGYIKKYAAAYNVCVFSPIIAQAILESKVRLNWQSTLITTLA